MRVAFNITHEKLSYQNFDWKLSGSTWVMAVVKSGKIYIGNAGDSRAVIARRNTEFIRTPHQLSRDHKPELEEEFERITSMNGRVFPFFNNQGNPVGPHRVWHPQLNFPGLAMSRSLGDYVAHQYGVSSEPELTEYNIQPQDEFLIVASDGVWEFLTNQEVIDIASIGIENDDYRKAASDIVKYSRNQWLKNDNCIDDITCVIIKLKH